MTIVPNPRANRKFQVINTVTGRIGWISRERTPTEVAALNRGEVHESTSTNDRAHALRLPNRRAY